MELYGQEFDLENPKSTFFHGDCIEGMKAFPDGYFDLILTDPPFGTTNNYWDIKPDIEKMFEQFNRIVKSEGAVLIFSQMPFSAELVTANRRYFRYEWIWEKRNGVGFLNSHKMPLRIHENILVFYDSLPTYNPQKSKAKEHRGNRKIIPASNTKNYGNFGKYSWTETGERYPTDIIKFDNSSKHKEMAESINATSKPVKLLEYLILTYTNPKEKVLDAFAGSGSTLVACHNLDRLSVGFEKDGEMYEKAKERIEKETAQMNIYDLLDETAGIK